MTEQWESLQALNLFMGYTHDDIVLGFYNMISPKL